MASAETELDIDQDLEFQRRDWTFERIGWLAMLLVIVAALVGFLGDGPVSRAQARASDQSIRVEYGRFARRGAMTELTVVVRRDSSSNAVTLWVSDTFLRGVHVKGIEPDPVRQLSAGDRTLFDIVVAADSARLTFAFTPRETGARRVELGLMGREPLALTQFVFP